MKATIDARQVLADGYQHALVLVAALPYEWQMVGREWYTLAHARVTDWSARTGYSEEQVSAVLANYNRNQAWSASKTVTERALVHGSVRGMSAVCRAVNAILALPRTATHAHVLPYLTNGSKTRHFYWSCLDVAGCPCDRHIYAVWRLPQSERYYPIVEEGVRLVACDLDVAPRQAEALVWLAYNYNRGRTMAQYLP